MDLLAKEADAFLNEFKRQSLRKTRNEVIPSLDGIPRMIIISNLIAYLILGSTLSLPEPRILHTGDFRKVPRTLLRRQERRGQGGRERSRRTWRMDTLTRGPERGEDRRRRRHTGVRSIQPRGPGGGLESLAVTSFLSRF